MRKKLVVIGCKVVNAVEFVFEIDVEFVVEVVVGIVVDVLVVGFVIVVVDTGIT